MHKLITDLFSDKKVLILGYGREGRATYSLLRRNLPEQKLFLADQNENLATDPALAGDPDLELILGENYLKRCNEFDYIVKSPGIAAVTLPANLDTSKLTSQTQLFLQQYRNQVIGVTGTKGKSTTSSLIYHILRSAGKDTVLVGNIGIPPFEKIDAISEHTHIVMELSSHQLEHVTVSPHIAIILNIFQEHLDHYHSYADYQKAKLKNTLFQDSKDYFIYCNENQTLADFAKVKAVKKYTQKFLPFQIDYFQGQGIHLLGSRIFLQLTKNQELICDFSAGNPLLGEHNVLNIMAAAAACRLSGLAAPEISQGLTTFKGLSHRLEFVAEKNGVRYYNDSISTIPQATIAAVKALQKVGTLILGGFDRGIDYSDLVSFLGENSIPNLIFVGEAGKRLMKNLETASIERTNWYFAEDYRQVVDYAAGQTPKGSVCLLSPAAASFDQFKNFEERGRYFKELVNALPE